MLLSAMFCSFFVKKRELLALGIIKRGYGLFNNSPTVSFQG